MGGPNVSGPGPATAKTETQARCDLSFSKTAMGGPNVSGPGPTTTNTETYAGVARSCP
jgi:hypothetical protein